MELGVRAAQFSLVNSASSPRLPNMNVGSAGTFLFGEGMCWKEQDGIRS